MAFPLSTIMQMRKYLLLLLTTLLITSCGGDTNAETPRDERTVTTALTTGSSQTTDLAIDCRLNDDQRKVTCTASGYTEGARLYWWTNSEQAESEGETFDFTITNPQPNLIVSFEECNSGSCETVTVTLDTMAGATLATPASTSPTRSNQKTSPPGSSQRITTPDAAPIFKALTQYVAFPDDVQNAFQSSVDTHFKAATEKAGLSVAVYQDGRLWEYATGNAQSSTPMTVNTPMLIRSVSKTLIAPLVLKQAETGSYKLSDTISEVLDGHPAHNLINSDFINPEVTVDQLLHMRSGLADYGEKKESNYTSIQTSVSWDPIALLRLVRTPYQPPGDYSYSNTNTVLLGLIAEHHGNQPLNRMLKQTFFDPLEISAGLLPQDAAPVNTARPHGDRRIWGGEGFGDLSELTTSWLDDWVLQTNRTTWIGGGVVTTAGNIAHWGYALFSKDGRALTPTLRAQLLDSFVGDPVHMGVSLLYGYHVTQLTLELNDGSSLPLYGHPGSGAGFTSILYYSPELDISISVLANSHSNIRGGGPENTALSGATLYSVLRDICLHYTNAANN